MGPEKSVGPGKKSGLAENPWAHNGVNLFAEIRGPRKLKKH